MAEIVSLTSTMLVFFSQQLMTEVLNMYVALSDSSPFLISSIFHLRLQGPDQIGHLQWSQGGTGSFAVHPQIGASGEKPEAAPRLLKTTALHLGGLYVEECFHIAPPTIKMAGGVICECSWP